MLWILLRGRSRLCRLEVGFGWTVAFILDISVIQYTLQKDAGHEDQFIASNSWSFYTFLRST